MPPWAIAGRSTSSAVGVAARKVMRGKMQALRRVAIALALSCIVGIRLSVATVATREAPHDAANFLPADLSLQHAGLVVYRCRRDLGIQSLVDRSCDQE